MRSVEWRTQIKSLRAYFAFILFHSINFINIRIHLLFITKKNKRAVLLISFSLSFFLSQKQKYQKFHATEKFQYVIDSNDILNRSE